MWRWPSRVVIGAFEVQPHRVAVDVPVVDADRSAHHVALQRDLATPATAADHGVGVGEREPFGAEREHRLGADRSRQADVARVARQRLVAERPHDLGRASVHASHTTTIWTGLRDRRRLRGGRERFEARPISAPRRAPERRRRSPGDRRRARHRSTRTRRSTDVARARHPFKPSREATDRVSRLQPLRTKSSSTYSNTRGRASASSKRRCTSSPRCPDPRSVRASCTRRRAVRRRQRRAPRRRRAHAAASSTKYRTSLSTIRSKAPDGQSSGRRCRAT